MFKSAATKIAHNTTIPALAGNSDLRPLQDLITAEKSVIVTLQKLRVDLSKAGDALRVWGQGEGDDLADILTASSTILAHFAASLSTYSSLHNTVREILKSLRTREEALDDLRRRRRRVGASAETAERKLNKMSPEHKNLGIQTDVLNRLRDEIRALEGEIIREEAELGDYKRKCTKDWMGFKFGGLAECCEKGVILGEIGRQIIQAIPEDTTQPGFPRAHYNAHGHVSDLLVEAQRAVSEVAFSGTPSGHLPIPAPISQPPPATPQDPSAKSPFLPTPSLGSELTLGVSAYNPLPAPPPANRRGSIDELGVHAPSAHASPQFSSLPTNMEHDPEPASLPINPTRPLSFSGPHDGEIAPNEENQSLMASIADALSYSQRGFSVDDATSHGHVATTEFVPKHERFTGEVVRSAQSEPHAPITNGHAGSPEEREGQWHRRATRRSTSPPNLPPGAAPAAIRAWDDRMGQGEDGTHSDRPASSSAGVPPQRTISSSEQGGEEEEGLPYDHESSSLGEEEGVYGHGKHYQEDTFSESGGEARVGAIASVLNGQDTTNVQRSVTSAASNAGNNTSLARAGSQWRIPRVPPPPADEDVDDIHTNVTHEQQSLYNAATDASEENDDTPTDESVDTRAHNEAAAREVSRAMDALMFSAVAPPLSSSGYTTPRAPPGYGSSLPTQSQAAASYAHASPQPSSMATGRVSYSSVPSSPILPPPNPPFASQGRTSPGEAPRHHFTSSESGPARIPTPTPTPATPTPGIGVTMASPTSPRLASSMYRSPPPEYPRPTPPFSTPLMARSTSSLNNTGGTVSPGGTPRTISAAAFRRQQARSPSGTESGPADTSPLTLRKPSLSPSPSSRLPSSVPAVAEQQPRVRLSVVNPDPRMSDDDGGGGAEEFDYIAAYGGENAGYGAGRYVSDLEG